MFAGAAVVRCVTRHLHGIELTRVYPKTCVVDGKSRYERLKLIGYQDDVCLSSMEGYFMAWM